MTDKELNTEQIILEAAESEFLEKGYGNTKTVNIARKAGVSTSMLHYYFRTKEKLFQMIFIQKAQSMINLFEGTVEHSLPFEEKVRLIVETHFDLISKAPKLPYFILNEILSNRENRRLLLDMLMPKVSEILNKTKELLDDAIAKGTIRPVKARDFIMNMASINVAVFAILPVLQEISPDMSADAIDNMLRERRESNVQFILNALKP